MSTAKIRLFVNAPLASDALISLHKKQAHYMLKVMRCNDGDKVVVFNGADGEWLAELVVESKNACAIRINEMLREQQAVPPIYLAFAPIKNGRIDFLAEKATELGCAGLLPVRTRRTIVSRVNEERLQANAIEAAEQTERLDIPTIEPYQKLEVFLHNLQENDVLIYCDETGEGKHPSQLLPAFKSKQQENTRFILLIGPEGGFDTVELQQLRALPQAHAMSLGPRILRADTAALSALTSMQLHLGDW